MAVDDNLLVQKCKREKGDVNVFIGTGSGGHTFPGATRKFGMVQLSPSNGVQNSWNFCSGYHYDAQEFAGLTHTALSGTGLGDLGDFLLTPICSSRMKRLKLDHEDECAVPGFYTIEFAECNMARLEATATTRVGLSRFFCQGAHCRLRFDTTWGQNSKTIQSKINIPNAKKSNNDILYFDGERQSSGFGRKRDTSGKIQFRALRHLFFSCLAMGVKRTITVSSKIIELHMDNFLEIRCALSSTSIKKAKLNLATEAPTNKSFVSIAHDALAEWNTILKDDFIIDIDEHMLGASVLRTALYHTLLTPNTISDVDGTAPLVFAPSFRKEHPSWTVSTLSTWDIFRTQFPWLTLFVPSAAKATADSMIRYATISQRLPKWLLAESETDVMIGYHGVAIITNAFLKGLVSSKHAAIHTILATTSSNNEPVVYYHKRGERYPSRDHVEAVSTGLEIAVDDTCAARVMEANGLRGHAIRLARRGSLYQAYFDNASSYFRGDDTEHFDPYEFHYSNRKNAHDFTEGSAAQYFFTPALVDPIGLIRLLGSVEEMKKRLDALFDPTFLRIQHGARDVTGCIGQCCLGNEVVHHVPYLYNAIRRFDLTQRRINDILLNSNLFGSGPDGLPGNDDCGQISAFLLLSALGIYPADPCSTVWQLGRPIVRAVNLTLGSIDQNNKKILRIIAHNQAPNHPYVQSVYLDGMKLSRSYLYHSELIAGPLIEFFMSPSFKPNYLSVAPSPKNQLEKKILISSRRRQTPRQRTAARFSTKNSRSSLFRS
mmetsp:Transcript_17952/g.26992  ORF Transcript_17952/g.26992 Transcript_17952/m.26992 type:complete len:772 (-) Transcript_17952:222-2537(-)